MILVTVCTLTFQYCLDKQHGRLHMTLNRFMSHIKHLRNAQQESSASRNGQQIVDGITQSQSLRNTQAIIWIPRDYLGVGANEIYHLRKYSNCLDVSIDGAYLDRHGKIILHGLPPIYNGATGLVNSIGT